MYGDWLGAWMLGFCSLLLPLAAFEAVISSATRAASDTSEAS